MRIPQPVPCRIGLLYSHINQDCIQLSPNPLICCCPRWNTRCVLAPGQTCPSTCPSTIHHYLLTHWLFINIHYLSSCLLAFAHAFSLLSNTSRASLPTPSIHITLLSFTTQTNNTAAMNSNHEGKWWLWTRMRQTTMCHEHWTITRFKP